MTNDSAKQTPRTNVFCVFVPAHLHADMWVKRLRDSHEKLELELSAKSEALEKAEAKLEDIEQENNRLWRDAQERNERIADLERQLASAQRETIRVYRDSEEHASYLRARFPAGKSASSISFEWNGRRWKYEHTDFDERGDFDLLLSALPITESAPPVSMATAEASHEASGTQGTADHKETDIWTGEEIALAGFDTPQYKFKRIT